ncbi:hypothetical protein CRYUN_Cryun04dG0187100 [Craigia yunnanensis]
MTQICPKMVKLSLIRLRVRRRVLILRRCICCFWDRLLMCSLGKPITYRMLSRVPTTAVPSPPSATVDGSFTASRNVTPRSCHHNHHDHKDSDLVPLKISLLGDPETGKTSFLVKYIGDEKDEQADIQEEGLNLMDKTFFVRGARIFYSIWEVDGGDKYQDHIPLACKDSVAILFMFDLTSRCTLNKYYLALFSPISPFQSTMNKNYSNIAIICPCTSKSGQFSKLNESLFCGCSVISWYQEARKWNQTAIPILIGTKFDDFIQLPIDLQWTIASQVNWYSKIIFVTILVKT